MEKVANNQYVEIAYDLYEVTPEGEVLRHQVPADQAERLVYGVTPGLLAPLSAAIDGLEEGASFTVTVKPEEGFGEYSDDLLRAEEIPASIFRGDDGAIDPEQIFPGAHIYLQTNIGQEVPATIVEVGDETVKVMVDFNHPLAGKTIVLKGTIVKVRPATAEEIAANQMQGGCGCGSCGDGGCGDGCNCGDEGCGCGK